MAIVFEANTLEYVASFAPLRCDTYFKRQIKEADAFFGQKQIDWVLMSSLVEDVRNGLNVGTEYYSMEPTDCLYISVSQVKEYGLSDKNQNYLTDAVKTIKPFRELGPNMLVITRSGTVGVGLSTDHWSFDFDKYSYVPSGFVITAKARKGIDANALASYINLRPVQTWLRAMAAGALQKNISQGVVSSLPVPKCLVEGDTAIFEAFDSYRKQSRKVVAEIARSEASLEQLRDSASKVVTDRINEIYDKRGAGS